MNYDDIIDLPAFHDPARPRMSNAARAAQFAPFKSLGSDTMDDIERDNLDGNFGADLI